ncbi:alpha/beta fold hydrolase [Microbulbifer sp. ZKSA006]|uniref:alpha/beta fold hydrolase n=1 Tax=Microbulbifer sp. ZKSA006 TaxID=3243390 RepID=UPI0040390E93
MSNIINKAVAHHTIQVGDVKVFYREAGDITAPTLLLLHGFPSSSHMYRNIIPKLAEKYHIVAPDLPGFGWTEAPKRGVFEYTFHNLYKTIEGFVGAISLERFAIMVFDYGAPVGFRLAANNPDMVSAIITQNGNMYEEGLLDAWEPTRKYWENPSQENRDNLRVLLKPESTQYQYHHGVPESHLSLISPDSIAHDQSILDRDCDIQLDLFGDYKSNVALYPEWQRYLRTYKPPVLATWGKNDPFFGPAGAEAFKKDVPDAEVHLFDTGHFALETHGGEISDLIIKFLARNIE